MRVSGSDDMGLSRSPQQADRPGRPHRDCEPTATSQRAAGLCGLGTNSSRGGQLYCASEVTI